MGWRAFLSGITVLIFAWAGPLPELAHQAFFAHMTMHMLVVAIAAPLLALGLSGSRFDPTTKYPLLFAPIPAAVAELMIVWGWHAPAPHHYARHDVVGLILEQGLFLLAGVWVWISSLSSQNRGAGIIGLLLTSMHMTLLGAILALSLRPLYPHHLGYAQLTVLEDQHLGGAIMLVVGGIVYLSGGLWLTLKIIGDSGEQKILEHS